MIGIYKVSGLQHLQLVCSGNNHKEGDINIASMNFNHSTKKIHNFSSIGSNNTDKKPSKSPSHGHNSRANNTINTTNNQQLNNQNSISGKATVNLPHSVSNAAHTRSNYHAPQSITPVTNYHTPTSVNPNHSPITHNINKKDDGNRPITDADLLTGYRAPSTSSFSTNTSRTLGSSNQYLRSSSPVGSYSPGIKNSHNDRNNVTQSDYYHTNVGKAAIQPNIHSSSATTLMHNTPKTQDVTNPVNHTTPNSVNITHRSPTPVRPLISHTPSVSYSDQHTPLVTTAKITSTQPTHQNTAHRSPTPVHTTHHSHTPTPVHTHHSHNTVNAAMNNTNYNHLNPNENLNKFSSNANYSQNLSNNSHSQNQKPHTSLYNPQSNSNNNEINKHTNKYNHVQSNSNQRSNSVGKKAALGAAVLGGTAGVVLASNEN